MYRVIDAIADFYTSSKTKKARRIAAARIVDKVKAVIKSKGEEGCTDSDFAHSFKLSEADLADFALRQLEIRGIVRKETRYFLAGE